MSHTLLPRQPAEALEGAATTNEDNRQLSDVKITDSASLRQAVEVLHTKFNIPHIVITSVSLPLGDSQTSQTRRTMSVVGSTRTSTGKPRLFKIHFPVFDCYFSGTGDMFAALMVVRMREAVYNSGKELRETESWLSGDEVAILNLPLAKAAEKVLASMHDVLSRTCESMEAEMRHEETVMEKGLDEDEQKRRLHLLRSRAAELKLVRNLDCLRRPNIEYRAEEF